MINDCTILGVSLLKVRKVGMRAWSIVRYTQLNEEKKGKTKRCFTLLLTYTHGNVPSIAGGKATTRTYTHTHTHTDGQGRHRREALLVVAQLLLCKETICTYFPCFFTIRRFFSVESIC